MRVGHGESTSEVRRRKAERPGRDDPSLEAAPGARPGIGLQVSAQIQTRNTALDRQARAHLHTVLLVVTTQHICITVSTVQ